MANENREASRAVRLRFEFYRDLSRRAIPLLLGSIALNVVLAIGIVFLATRPIEYRYFATRLDGAITPIVPLDQPMVNEASLLEWASRAALKVNTYNFTEWRQQFMEMADLFTRRGWEEYRLALQNSANLEAVVGRSLNHTAQLRGAPVVVERGVVNGVYTWILSVPVQISLSAPNGTQTQSVNFRMMVVRRPTLDSRDGLGLAIEQIVGTTSR